MKDNGIYPEVIPTKEGNTYFRIHREHHNLDRARTRMKLVKDMENKWEEMNAIVKKFRNTI